MGRKEDREKAAYIARVKKMALYDAKDYFDIITAENGSQKILLKSGEEIDWDIVEAVEVADGKVKLKFPDRAKAMEKYGKIIMEEKAGQPREIRAVFKGQSDD
ncbi:MAG: hypothetical protein AB1Z19_02330 [Eubacteriales bacterium]